MRRRLIYSIYNVQQRRKIFQAKFCVFVLVFLCCHFVSTAKGLPIRGKAVKTFSNIKFLPLNDIQSQIRKQSLKYRIFGNNKNTNMVVYNIDLINEAKIFAEINIEQLIQEIAVFGKNRFHLHENITDQMKIVAYLVNELIQGLTIPTEYSQILQRIDATKIFNEVVFSDLNIEKINKELAKFKTTFEKLNGAYKQVLQTFQRDEPEIERRLNEHASVRFKKLMSSLTELPNDMNRDLAYVKSILETNQNMVYRNPISKIEDPNPEAWALSLILTHLKVQRLLINFYEALTKHANQPAVF